MKKRWIIVLCITFFGMLLPVPSSAGHDHSGPNPLMEEMLLLDTAFREVVSAVALGDGERVHKALHSMHGTMEKTHKGVHAGSVVIPKNAHRINEFVAMDKEFHQTLEKLAEGAHRNDRKEMLSLTKRLLDGCVQCHQTFRK
ncbi:MAG: hypothetical protein K8I29_16345 [Alphaproteobacteria bacterium]|uniref:Cytochrome c n=1 Tax=Candidatus Nitrobium versatile TaxID=2884831 RepID=A0A953SE81_9BACT|nr:hypothetical protein [Candidatus Nitrobium versatile]